MPVDPRFGSAIGQDVEGAAGHVRFGDARADAQRFNVTALQVRPLVQLLAGLL